MSNEPTAGAVRAANAILAMLEPTFGAWTEKDEAVAAIIDREMHAKEIADLREDRARLEWVEQNGHDLHICCWKGAGCMSNPWTIHRGEFCETDPIGEADTFRESIDAARKVYL